GGRLWQRSVPRSARCDKRPASADPRTPPRRTRNGIGRLSRRRRADHRLISECAAVLARLRAPDQHAAVPIDLDGLRAAPGRTRHYNIVPPRLEPRDRRGWRSVLNVGLFSLKEEARSVDCLLNVHAIVEHIEDDLR